MTEIIYHTHTSPANAMESNFVPISKIALTWSQEAPGPQWYGAAAAATQSRQTPERRCLLSGGPLYLHEPPNEAAILCRSVIHGADRRPAGHCTHVIVYPTECFRNAGRIIEVSFHHGYLGFAIDVNS